MSRRPHRCCRRHVRATLKQLGYIVVESKRRGPFSLVALGNEHASHGHGPIVLRGDSAFTNEELRAVARDRRVRLLEQDR